MGKIGADFLIGVVGAIVLAHAAYATIIYRSELKIKEEEFVRPPLQVLVEVAVSLGLCFWAALRVPGTFLPILPDSKENRVVMLHSNLDFMVFNHRGKLFPPALEVKF
ncbi:membrane magnesium transporter 1 [Marchantia polymorpha subsp. ruderalis]|uniref:Membrane magnesium transporter n=2 Tax=Marchantia polymorpha TaxID=3197 RepID=A0A176WDR2_MARPO|nr:hypothetical protein AXG93_1962s1140 [Marchantia polymorpha subsp. ruderalis]PTQ46490.1 hypothetical protein MARPO_0011s0153 [Marchantia polymorpha]BBN08454.1 hypothetical protein Mp_4g11680 [Marchantia polymorpha subsp. ruderalis]|eukprot:PTQ46490.1 hypothetical protein MARPO_0011s0153 [Marchantia polymorpha]